MFKIVLIFGLAVAACYADEPAPPAPAPKPPQSPQTPAPQAQAPANSGPGVYCGYIPGNLFKCLKNPISLVTPEISSKCDKEENECKKMTCIFRQRLWLSLDETQIDKKKINAYFDNITKTQPEWSAAVNHLKLACLEHPLPAQGAFLNCPAFDIVHCVLTSMIRNGPAALWSTSKDCEYPRQYSVACPICPDSCFTSAVPYGTCNACLSLPRSP